MRVNLILIVQTRFQKGTDMIRRTSIVIAAAVGTSILAAAAMQTGQQQREQQIRDRDRQAETFEGKIVDLHHYLTLEGSPDFGDPGIAGENFGGPVGLLVEEDRMIRGPRTVLYVVLVEPEREMPQRGGDEMPEPGGPQQHGQNPDHHKAASKKYKEAQDMTGSNVTITGREIERDNVKAIVIRTIEPKTGAQERERAQERRDRGQPQR
jgi:hypothetical protein